MKEYQQEEFVQEKNSEKDKYNQLPFNNILINSCRANNSKCKSKTNRLSQRIVIPNLVQLLIQLIRKIEAIAIIDNMIIKSTATIYQK